MPELLSDILAADADRRERAYRYERAVANQVTAKQQLERLEGEVAKFNKVISDIEKTEEWALKIPKDAPSGDYELRSVVLGHLGKGRAWQENRRNKVNAQLVALHAELPRLDAAVAEFRA